MRLVTLTHFIVIINASTYYQFEVILQSRRNNFVRLRRRVYNDCTHHLRKSMVLIWVLPVCTDKHTHAKTCTSLPGKVSPKHVFGQNSLVGPVPRRFFIVCSICRFCQRLFHSFGKYFYYFCLLFRVNKEKNSPTFHCISNHYLRWVILVSFIQKVY